MSRRTIASMALLAGLTAADLPVAGPLPFTLVGDPSTRLLWGQIVASPGDDWINDLVPLRSGHVVGVGFVNRSDGLAPNADWQAVAVELDADGRIASDHRYGAAGGVDAFWSMLETADSRRMYAGFTTRVGGGGINAYSLLARPDGTIIKENAHGGGGYDRFTDLAPAADGFVFLGHSQLPEEAVKRRIFIVKTNDAGVPVWERIHGGEHSWGALYIEPAGDGGYVIAGGVDTGQDRNMFVLKVDAEGRELWRRQVGTPDWDEINHGLVMRPDGSIVLVGYTHARGAELNDIVAATVSAAGEVVRIERWGGARDDRAILAKAGNDGRVWIVGQTNSAGAGGSDVVVTHLDRGGAFAGQALIFGGAADDNGTAILPLDDGSLLVAGYSRNLGRGGQDAFIARLSKPAADRPHPAFRRTVVRAR